MVKRLTKSTIFCKKSGKQKKFFIAEPFFLSAPSLVYKK